MSERQSAPERLALGAIVTGHATRLDVALAGASGAIVRQAHRAAKAPLDPQAMLALFGEVAGVVIHTPGRPDFTISGVALALEGALDADRGVVLDLPPLTTWEGVPLAAPLAAIAGAPARIDTLDNAALLGELQRGAGREARSALLLETSRAITVSLWQQGTLAHAPHFGAVGHLPVRPDGPRCACGGRGHLEAVASAQALVRRMIGLLVEAPSAERGVMAITGGRAESLTAQHIWQLASDGEPTARALMEEALDALAMTVVFLLITLDSERLIIGGALARCGPTWLDALRERVARLAPPRRAIDLATRLCLAELGPAAALTGAVALALAESRAGRAPEKDSA